MRTLLRSTLLLFRTHLRMVVRSRRALLCTFLAALPPALGALVLRFGPPVLADRLGSLLGWLLTLQVIVPILALVAGSAVLTEEIENRTITYVFTRPIPRSALLLGRWLATVLLVSTLLGASAYLTGRVAERGQPPVEARIEANAAWNKKWREGPWAQRHREQEQKRFEIESAHSPEERALFMQAVLRRLFWASLLGGVVYTSLFTLIGVFLRHPMVVGLGYAFAIEGLLANLPGESQTLTVQYYLRCILVDPRLYAFHRLYPYGFEDFDPPRAAALTLVVVTAIVMAVASWAIGRRQYVLSA